MMRRTLILLAAMAILILGGTASGDWVLNGAFDYETAETGLLYYPDPNGGLGVMVLTDSHIPDATEDNFAVGPCVEFNLTGLYDTVWGTILPGEWKPSDSVPATPFGKLGVLWQTESEDLDMVFVAATGLRFLPDHKIQPTVWTEAIKFESETPEIKLMFGATIWLGGK